MQELQSLIAIGAVKYYEKQSSTLLIWFGGINEPFFSSKMPNISNSDCLYFRDDNKDWYMDGIHLLTGGFTESVRAIVEFINSKRYKDVFIAGQSSGGYASLRFGHAIKPTAVFAFSPQTKNIYSGQCQMCPHVRLEDLGLLFTSEPVGFQVVLNLARSEKSHSSEFFWDDWRQIGTLNDLDNVTTIKHPIDNHSVTVILRERGRLYKIVSGLMTAFGS